jgi:NO-binding membrane sensor protein with MHYT domain
MGRVFDCLVQDHDVRIIALAALICAAGCSAFVALATQQTMHVSRTRRILRNLIDALVLAHTVWTTHFVAMIGHRPEVASAYQIEQTIASYIVVFISSYIAVLLLERASIKYRVAAGIVFSLGLASMHYVDLPQDFRTVSCLGDGLLGRGSDAQGAVYGRTDGGDPAGSGS